jgi:hemoglobin-like flavoprotein
VTPDQKQLLRRSFEALLPVLQETGAVFYNRLFELDPSIRPLFRGSRQAQERKLMETLGQAIGCLDRYDQLVPLLWQLGKRHGTYGVQPEHYKTVGQALTWTLEHQLCEAFTPEVRAAWEELYAHMAETMKRAAAEGGDGLPGREPGML